MKRKQQRRKGHIYAVPAVLLAGVVALAAVSRVSGSNGNSDTESDAQFRLDRVLASSLGTAIRHGEFPSEVELPLNEQEPAKRVSVEYSMLPTAQEKVEKLFEMYKPDYGAFVAMDATTGRILTLVSYIKDADIQDNMALRATFPAASVFKVVTAAAALGTRKVNSETVIPFNGRSHTLYRRNVLHTKKNRWTRYVTLREAFGRSINTVFGKLGIFFVGPDDLREYAERFRFNHPIQSDLPIQMARAVVHDDQMKLAESASGFNRWTTLSPVHGAMIAAAVANDGVMMEPYVVQSAQSADGTFSYRPQPTVASVPVDPITASELKAMMEETVYRGTTRGIFRSFLRKRRFQDIKVGGKTGSLTGNDPEGKTDWFVGYASRGDQKIAFAALTVHRRYWTVKSAYLARRYIETYFGDRAIGRELAANTSVDDSADRISRTR